MKRYIVPLLAACLLLTAGCAKAPDTAEPSADPAAAASAALHCLKEVETIKGDIAEIILSDIACARHLLQACIKCSVESIQANLPFIKNEDRVNELNKQITTLLKAC